MDAVAVILDVGAHMQNAPAGYVTPIESSVDCLKMLVQRKLFAEKKESFCLVLCGTEVTDNELVDEDGNFEYISMARELAPLSWDLIEFLNNGIDTQTATGDIIDALMVGADHLVKQTQAIKKVKSKKLLVFSNLDGLCNTEELSRIAKRLKKAEIELLLVGPDLPEEEDDEEGGGAMGNGSGDGEDHEERKPKSENQQKNEQAMAKLIQALDGESWSFEEAVSALSYFESRGVMQRAWPVEFEVGENLRIKVNGYTKVKAVRPKPMKKVYARDPDEAITTASSYHRNDEAETEVDAEDTVKGYRYGNTLVPFSEEDMENLKLKVEKCLRLLCFTSVDNVPHNLRVGDSVLVFTADVKHEASQRGFNALIRALYERNAVAIVRRVYNRVSAPRLGALIPKVKAEYEALEYVELPFAEDIRRFTFGTLPLDLEKEMEEIRAQLRKMAPSTEQLQAVDDLITEMDLSKDRCTNEFECDEVLKPARCINPHLQHLFSSAAVRAQDPSAPLPEPNALVTACLEMPEQIAAGASAACERLRGLFELKRREEPKKKTAEAMFGVEEAGPAPGPSDEAPAPTLADEIRVRVDQVGSVDPIGDFRDLSSRGLFSEAMSQMQRRIDQLVTDSFGDQFFPKAMACLLALREESIARHEASAFNSFLQNWQPGLQGGNKRAFWQKMCKERVTLISSEEAAEGVSPAEAAAFLPSEPVPMEESAPGGKSDDMDELLNDMD